MENKRKMKKTVRYIPAKTNLSDPINTGTKKLRVAAYCRVSTKEEEQLNSYEVQRKYYTEKINNEPEWELVGIFADKGITGTSVKKRDKFLQMIRMCKRNKIDLILTKSISRFARNTVDCLHYVRLLKELNVDVFFEEQGLHSIQNGSEFYITIYGSIAQSESENISANVRWGKEQSARKGNVSFHYKNFLGYRKGEDGQPEIDPDQAEIVKEIYHRFLMGDSLNKIAKYLTEKNIPTPAGKEIWQTSTIKSILKNERYKGDALLNKTYVVDCLSKKTKINCGERPQYYVEDNHPAIIDRATFGRVQEELARRSGKQKVKRVGTKTENGKYSSKYALTELLICGESGTPYRRCTWNIRGKQKIVWRCINRLDFGKKYCKNSPSMEESSLQNAIMNAIVKMAKQNADVLEVLKINIGMGIGTSNCGERNRLNLQIEIEKIESEFNSILCQITDDIQDRETNEMKLEKLIAQKRKLEKQLEECQEHEEKQERTNSRLEEISNTLSRLQYQPIEFNDQIVRQILEKVVVESKQRIRIVFVGGYEVIQEV
ncbi:recombinase family protein [Clostridium facile]|uniref:Recombinase family protein n=1 Tax=Clostridium facile TaxID=2763035 RepID=A0ABR7IPP1_9CLOT|nr:recombinase family protein [Clostridium facile]MBC5787082.1 recombinase family protein [Clostridium facile]